MRRMWLSALCTIACAGGQTGEITGLTACREPVGTAEVGERSAAGASAEEQMARVTTSTEAGFAWPDDSACAISASFALDGSPATLLGGPECARPWLEAPVIVTLRTTDGALEETIEGVALLTDAGASVRATVPVNALNGELMADHTELDPERAVFRIDLIAAPDALSGVLTLSADPDGESELLATF